jgi:acetyl-CoA carboxylase biotin carboxylase subunit
MFRKILIANRGEIAVRIIRACKEMGIKTVAVFSTADRDSLHVRYADQSICIGPPPSSKSYLNISSIISAAEITDSEAIHPGYGFLSENSNFAEICENCGIKFIGPTSANMSLLGNKRNARKLVQSLDIPVLPGSDDIGDDEEDIKKAAEKIGYPLILKASMGGGGRGIKMVLTPAHLSQAYHQARQEAQSFFGDKDVYLEKYCENPRHIEFQVLADRYGNAVYLGERDCSIQRRHQKIIEEAPSLSVKSSARKKIGELILKVVKEIGYINAATFEFLLDESGEFYFMEVNTRVQVEHPVTEFVTGTDIIKEQIRIANGDRLKIKQEDVKIKGHSIELRINAENPVNFKPSPGLITFYNKPGGLNVRVDDFVYCGYNVQPFYDSLIAKLIVYDTTRAGAINKAKNALNEFRIEGIETNIPFLKRILNDSDYVSGSVDIGYVQRFIER